MSPPSYAAVPGCQGHQHGEQKEWNDEGRLRKSGYATVRALLDDPTVADTNDIDTDRTRADRVPLLRRV